MSDPLLTSTLASGIRTIIQTRSFHVRLAREVYMMLLRVVYKLLLVSISAE